MKSLKKVLIGIVIGFVLTLATLAVPKAGVSNEALREMHFGFPFWFVQQDVTVIDRPLPVDLAMQSPWQNPTDINLIGFFGSWVVLSLIFVLMIEIGVRLKARGGASHTRIMKDDFLKITLSVLGAVSLTCVAFAGGVYFYSADLKKTLDQHERYSKSPQSDVSYYDFYRASVPELNSDRVLIEDTKNCGKYYRDSDRIYYRDLLINNADPDSFEFVGYVRYGLYEVYCLSKDKNHVFDKSEILDWLDPATVATEGIYVKDKNGVYYGAYHNIVPYADPETFFVTSTDMIATDASWVYECGKRVMPNQDGAIPLGDYYGKTDSVIYHMGLEILGADVGTFKVLFGDGFIFCESRAGGYAVDHNGVYFAGRLIDGADPETFELMDRVGYAKDRVAVYARGIALRNDFNTCSTNPADLPGGLSVWSKIIPEVNLSASSTLFEFCTTKKGDLLVGYRTDTDTEGKTYVFFSPDRKPIGTTELICDDEMNGYRRDRSLLPQSIQYLQGRHVRLSCVLDDGACIGQDFYDLDLDVLQNSSDGAITHVEDEYYDCGYRG